MLSFASFHLLRIVYADFEKRNLRVLTYQWQVLRGWILRLRAFNSAMQCSSVFMKICRIRQLGARIRGAMDDGAIMAVAVAVAVAMAKPVIPRKNLWCKPASSVRIMGTFGVFCIDGQELLQRIYASFMAIRRRLLAGSCYVERQTSGL